MRIATKLLILLLLTPFLANFKLSADQSAGRPNIVMIVADDQRSDTIHALGNQRIETPNLDRLVRSGSSFTRALAAYPICHVSRAEILTGCTAFRAYPNYPQGPIDARLATFARTFQQAGYATCYTGKWHTDGHPQQHGYSVTSGLFSSGGARGLASLPVDSQGHAITGYVGWTFKDVAGKVESSKGAGLTPQTSEHIADGAIAFINQQHSTSFFLHVNFAAPHDPRLMPKGYEHMYDATTFPLPQNFAPQHPFDHGNIDGRDERLLAKPLDATDLKRELACYYAVISDMDAHIGRILSSLESNSLMDNTLVVFTADQGLALGSHGLLGKQNMYEHTIGVPLIIAGPGIPVGKRVASQCYLRDLFPTCCEIASIPIPDSVQGKSFLPVVQGRADRTYDFTVAYFTDTQRMMRDDRWKYVNYPKALRQQLFDVLSDPLEMHDLSARPDQAERIANLKGKLTEWLRASGDEY